MRTDPYRPLVGLLAGAAGCVAFLGFGMLALPVLVLALIWLAVVKDPATMGGSALVGAGATALILALAANARCGSGCVAPDLLPFNLVASVLIVIGIVLVALRPRPQRRV